MVSYMGGALHVNNFGKYCPKFELDNETHFKTMSYLVTSPLQRQPTYIRHLISCSVGPALRPELLLAYLEVKWLTLTVKSISISGHLTHPLYYMFMIIVLHCPTALLFLSNMHDNTVIQKPVRPLPPHSLCIFASSSIKITKRYTSLFGYL